MKIAFLSSARGTNLQSFIDAKKAGTFKPDIACLITNAVDCGAVQKAKAAGIPAHFIDPSGKTREEYDREVMKTLGPYQVDLIVLGGYMRLIGPEMVKRYQNRILNVHPSLLPKFAGGMDTDVHQAVLEAGEKETGITVHVVTDQLDAGPIIFQKSVPVEPDDTAKTLKAKVQKLEQEWYPAVVKDFEIPL